jgi:hypothetical protein
MSESDTDLLTVSEICRTLGIQRWRFIHAADAYRIEPARRAGIVRLYRRDQLTTIRAALERVARRRVGGPP